MLMMHSSASITSPQKPYIFTTCRAVSFFALLHQALGSPYQIVPLRDHPPTPPTVLFTSFAHRQLQPSLSAGFRDIQIYTITLSVYVGTLLPKIMMSPKMVLELRSFQCVCIKTLATIWNRHCIVLSSRKHPEYPKRISRRKHRHIPFVGFAWAHSITVRGTQLAPCPFSKVSSRGIMLNAPTGQALVQTSQPAQSPLLLCMPVIPGTDQHLVGSASTYNLLYSLINDALQLYLTLMINLEHTCAIVRRGLDSEVQPCIGVSTLGLEAAKLYLS